MNNDITCYCPWESDKNLLREKEKKLVWILRNIEYRVIHSRFLTSWSISQDSCYHELQPRVLPRGRKKDSCLNFKKSWISYQSCLILFFLNYQIRIFLLSFRIKSCMKSMSRKNHGWYLRKARIWKERWQDHRLVIVLFILLKIFFILK